MSQTGVVFLMYHELQPSGGELTQAEAGYVRYVVRLPDFRSQMELLKREGWKGVSVSDAVNSFAERTVAITFDDGCETDLIYAAPTLLDLKFNGSFYLTTGFLGKNRYLSHSQARELSGLGFEIGCHSMNHLYLTDLGEKDLHREVEEAKIQLEQIIGKAVRHFSCPGGRHNRRVSTAAREAGYETVATSRVATNSNTSDRMALCRVAIMRSTSLASFERLCNGQHLWRMQLEVQLRNASKKLLGNSVYDHLRSVLLRDSTS
jgi:peptidoglycan/xylan/chitin deacetylase (PgdA/CDA1 family)